MADVKSPDDPGKTSIRATGPPAPRPSGGGTPPLARRLLAEAVGTALLVTVVVGSGIAAQRLSPNDIGLQLLENSTATVFGLTVLILQFGPVSGAHFNPVVSAADWLLGHRSGHGLTGRDVGAYTLAQSVGAIAGAVLANAMYSIAPIQISTHHRATPGVLLGEAVATAGLIGLIFALARSGRAPLSAAAVGAYIGSAYWYTSSTSFANPAVTSPTPSPGSPPPRSHPSSPPRSSVPRSAQPWSGRCTRTSAKPPTTSSSPTSTRAITPEPPRLDPTQSPTAQPTDKAPTR